MKIRLTNEEFESMIYSIPEDYIVKASFSRYLINESGTATILQYKKLQKST